jgi:hypothetical protein
MKASIKNFAKSIVSSLTPAAFAPKRLADPVPAPAPLPPPPCLFKK